jgi:ATP-dependent exoDNAse (exonuclease V) beta subunit
MPPTPGHWGAPLRGPLVARPLSLWIDPALLPDGLIKRAIGRLEPLAVRSRSRTPYATLSAALEQLEVRALVLQRHGGKAERALANVERFLESARPWSVRGLRGFAQEVFDKWSESERSQEGRPEAEEGSVTLITVHSAKGLDWMVVIPINMLGKPDSLKPPFVDRSDNRLWCKIGQVTPPGYDEARDREKAASQAERVRLLYVAATRARDFLVVPGPEWKVVPKYWLALAGLHAIEGPTIPMVEADPLPESNGAPCGKKATRKRVSRRERRTFGLSTRETCKACEERSTLGRRDRIGNRERTESRAHVTTYDEDTTPVRCVFNGNNAQAQVAQWLRDHIHASTRNQKESMIRMRSRK